MTALLLCDSLKPAAWLNQPTRREGHVQKTAFSAQAVSYSLLEDLWHTLQINFWQPLLPMSHYAYYTIFEDPTISGWNLATVNPELIALVVRLLHLFVMTLLLYTCLQ